MKEENKVNSFTFTVEAIFALVTTFLIYENLKNVKNDPNFITLLLLYLILIIISYYSHKSIKEATATFLIAAAFELPPVRSMLAAMMGIFILIEVIITIIPLLMESLNNENRNIRLKASPPPFSLMSSCVIVGVLSWYLFHYHLSCSASLLSSSSFPEASDLSVNGIFKIFFPVIRKMMLCDLRIVLELIYQPSIHYLSNSPRWHPIVYAVSPFVFWIWTSFSLNLAFVISDFRAKNIFISILIAPLGGISGLLLSWVGIFSASLLYVPVVALLKLLSLSFRAIGSNFEASGVDVIIDLLGLLVIISWFVGGVIGLSKTINAFDFER